ncbi:formin-like protein 5 [Bubalus bubalis]|uniref:formin-like protein 5 n=1 Tax=Bubalus bubalis TaxID=89462 RepID=UPI001E1B8F88|nr:formin-like protein 5 [Bubalus bubalis]
MVSARGTSLLLLESRSSYTLSSSPQHCGPGGEVTPPPPLRRVARLLPPQLGQRWSGGGVCPQDFLGSGGKRADSSDAGLAGFASFYCILLLIKKLRVHRRPSPLSSWLSPPPLPLARDLPNPAPPKPLSGPAAPLGPPRPPPPPLRPHPTALASGFAAQKQQRQRRQLRAQPLPRPAGGTRTRRPRSRAELRGAARGTLGRWHPGSRPNARRPAPRLPRAGPRSPASAVPGASRAGERAEEQVPESGWEPTGAPTAGGCPVWSPLTALDGEGTLCPALVPTDCHLHCFQPSPDLHTGLPWVLPQHCASPGTTGTSLDPGADISGSCLTLFLPQTERHSL